MQAAKLLGAPKEACSVRCPFWGRLRGSRHSLEPPDCRLWINQQPQPQLLSQPQPLLLEEPKPQPPQQTSMRTKIRIQVQLFPPKQLLHIQKTSFFCLHHILCRNLKMCYGKLKALQRVLNGGIGNHRYFIRRADIIHIFLVFLA